MRRFTLILLVLLFTLIVAGALIQLRQPNDPARFEDPARPSLITPPT
ncbi:hypothetical protein BH20ACT24_BH20ACT24_18040 [soil metagenome]